MLYHIVPRADFEAARASGTYTPSAYAREGFVHCSYLRQLMATAERIFAGREDLVILEMEPSALSARIVDENLEGGRELYPHVYGTIPVSAVTRVLDLRWDGDHFVAPPELALTGRR